MPVEDLPDWLPAWCLDQLGAEPVGVLFRVRQVSMVFGVRLPGGTDVVVKARADDGCAGETSLSDDALRAQAADRLRCANA